ncbi:MAG: sugar phosphate nucleotidyltransferase [Chloroflexi bacterium]|nr:sugar phosphate nucleotidyltransferase [Chloroflexota bacterium]
MNDILAVILGGGRGSRLFPLTKLRSKPAVPIAGKYRLIDIPLSNCINSGIYRIDVLTQFNSHSLQRHINQTYNFDKFHTGFVEILAADSASNYSRSAPHGQNMCWSWPETLSTAWITPRWPNSTGSTMQILPLPSNRSCEKKRPAWAS